MRFALTCAAAALAISSVAVAAEPTSTASATTAKGAPTKKTRKICRRETSTGSTIPKKVCRTVEERTDEAKQSAAPAPATAEPRADNPAQ